MSYIIQLTPKNALFVGSFTNAQNIEFLKQAEITMIVNCTTELPNFFEDQIKYLKCKIEDHPSADISQYFDPVYQFVMENLPSNKNLLIHCAFGVSRSATIAISLIMRLANMKRMDAQSILEIRRPEISPNHGFVKQLMAFEETIWKPDTIDQQQEQVQQLKQNEPDNSLLEGISACIQEQFRTEFKCSFRCRKCKVEIFQSSSMVHGLSNSCHSIYVDFPKWLPPLQGNDGTLTCQKCSSKIGAYKLSGIRCSCDEWIIPGYQLQKFKLDRKVWNVKTQSWN